MSRRFSLLWVDDDPSMIMPVLQELANFGTCELATTVHLALTKAERRDYDIVIIDARVRLGKDYSGSALDEAELDFAGLQVARALVKRGQTRSKTSEQH